MLSQLRICSQKTFEEKGLEYVQTHAVGTGPFVFESMVDGDSITYVRNDNYWIEGLPYLDGIKITIIKDDNTRLSAMSNGEIDLIATNSSTLAEKLDQLSGINMISADSAAAKGYYYIAVDSYNEDKPTYDVRVRQAIMYGVDRNSSVPAITSGYYEAINQLALEGSYAYLEDDQLYSTYDYDPEKAKELLTEAGYPNGFDTMHHSRSGGLYEAIAVTMQSYLKEIGINMDITVMGDSATVSRLTSGNSNGEITFTSAGTSPCSFNNYTNWIQFIGKDRSRYQDIVGDFEELDVLLDKASAAAEIDDIKKSLQEVNYWLNENLILMPWCYHYFRCYSADDLHDTGWYQVHDYQSTFQLAYFD